MKNEKIVGLDFNKKFYTIEEIAKLLSKSSITVSHSLKEKGYKPVRRKKLRNGILKYYFKKLDVYKFINLAIYLPVVKNAKKQYFEFSEIVLESKINYNGFD